MGCGYMGCATFLNKMAWTVFAVLLGLAAVLLGIGLARAAPCTKTLTNCTRNNPGYVRDKNVCNLPFRACARSHLIVAGVGVIALILGVCTLCFMCCCSKPPPPKPAAGQPYGNMTGMVQMQGYPTAAPAGVMGQQQQPAYTQPYPYTPYNSQGPAAAQPFAQQPQDVPITRY